MSEITGDMMKNISFLGLCLVAIIITAGVAYAAKSPISANDASSTKLKSDIVISNVQITRVDGTSELDNVRIAATITNTVRGTSTGPFKVRVDWRAIPRTAPEWSDDPDFLADIPWNYLNSAGVQNLINDPSRRSMPSVTLYFDHVVPLEQLESNRYVYLVTADYMNQVDEAKEHNNASGECYPSRYYTPG